MKGVAKTAGEYGHVDLVEKPRPEPGPREAVVEVAYAGLCGSDVGLYEFEAAYEFVEFPRLIGHEYSGTVVETGEDVTEFAVGDRVVEEPLRGCGVCYHCESGSPNLCVDAQITGLHHDGAFAEYVRVPEDALHAIPDDLSLERAAVVEPTSVAARAVRKLSRVSAGDEVLVEGPGPIGLLTAQIADAQGGNVLVSGVGQDTEVRLPIAEKLGLDTIDVEADDVGAAADARTGGLGFDVVFDATGHPSGLGTAADVVRKGGQIVVVGIAGATELDYADLVRGEVDLQCSYASDWEDFERAIAMLLSGDVEADPMIDTGHSLHDAAGAFEAAVNAEVCKVRFDASELRG